MKKLMRLLSKHDCYNIFLVGQIQNANTTFLLAIKKTLISKYIAYFQKHVPPLRYQTYFIYLLIFPLKNDNLNLSGKLTFPLPIIQRNNNTRSPPLASKAAAAETVESVLTDIIKGKRVFRERFSFNHCW